MDLDGVGGRCSLPSCRQVDYLPFRCPHCAILFCQQHYLPQAHQCTDSSAPGIGGSHSASSKVTAPPVCPICLAVVPVGSSHGLITVTDRTAGTQEENDAAIARHIEQGCPARARANPICAFHECSTREPVPIICRTCRRQFCVAHRLEVDHECSTANRSSSTNNFSHPSSRSHRPPGYPLGINPALRHPSSTQSISVQHPCTRKASKSSFLNISPEDSRSVGGQNASNTSSASHPVYKNNIVEDIPLTVFANTPATFRGNAKNIPEDCRRLFAVYYPSCLQRKAEYWILNARHSPGKILDALQLPAPPANAANARYSMYAVKQDRRGVNLLPTITPLRDLGPEILQEGDVIVVEIGDQGLDQIWIDALQPAAWSKFERRRSKNRKSSKCILS